ncbi:sugar phosphate isomerase/epimerase [Streptomyces sp. GC420]|uniref:sugar phosphate isomerase/epimerase family protein n=1 Tax=Streptomyces sp. GC420 TaxID=2697568 RepID=UPI0014150720|nr:sugar phosphate isomerase/epimerase [Streptomyces sp. GC420]NBM16248.1 TIM barrel protein [Streptomyces sp. GC420]
MSRKHTPADEELARRLSRRGMLGVAAGATAATLLGAAAVPAAAATTTGPAGSPGTADRSTADRSRGTGRGRPVLPPGRLGIQLYSLRDKVSTLGFAPVFAELERYGYDEIEFAGYTQGSAGAISLARLRRLARDHGLNPIGSHVGYYADDPAAYTFAQNLSKVLDDAEALGLKHIGTASGPWRYGDTVDGWKRCAEEFNQYGAEAKKRGMKFYQHNHAEEFSFASDRPDVRLYDVLLAETDPGLVYLEMDVYWAYAGQFRFGRRADGTPAPFEPLDYVLRQPHRYPLFHVKDGERDDSVRDGYRMVDVGDGDIDYRRFMSAVTRPHGGRRYHHWQAEHDNPADSFLFARKSSDHLHSLRDGGC